MKQKICVIYGGRSGEHEVSVTSAESIIAALGKTKYDVRAVAISKSGKWIPDVFPAEYRRKYLGSEGVFGTEFSSGIFHSDPVEPEIVMPVLHGPFGEDGTIQGLLEMLNVPYVGSGVLGSSLAMDKAAAKYMCLAYGIPVVEFLDFIRLQWDSEQASVLDGVEDNIGYPCFVKPANLGSSIGISKATDRECLIDSVCDAFQYDKKILIERAVNCRELECSVIGNDQPEASLAGEVIPCNEFYDYNAKYIDGKSQLIIPAQIPTEIHAQVQDIAVQAFKALGCSGMARADFFLDKDSGEVFFNEINTIPGFTSISMYPKLWEASGLPYMELLDKLIELALERFVEKQQIHGNIFNPEGLEKK